jgi:uncharacterized membrane protein YtjA (UPF0391 family)
MRKLAGLFFAIASSAAVSGFTVVAMSDAAIANLLFSMLLVTAALFLISAMIALFTGTGRKVSVTRPIRADSTMADRVRQTADERGYYATPRAATRRGAGGS